MLQAPQATKRRASSGCRSPDESESNMLAEDPSWKVIRE
jgi:hypothetical protein